MSVYAPWAWYIHGLYCHSPKYRRNQHSTFCILLLSSKCHKSPRPRSCLEKVPRVLCLKGKVLPHLVLRQGWEAEGIILRIPLLPLPLPIVGRSLGRQAAGLGVFSNAWPRA